MTGATVGAVRDLGGFEGDEQGCQSGRTTATLLLGRRRSPRLASPGRSPALLRSCLRPAGGKHKCKDTAETPGTAQGARADSEVSPMMGFAMEIPIVWGAAGGG